MIPGWRVEEHPRGSRADWMAKRQRVLCAGEAGALFGRHKYTTARRLFTAKAYGEPEEESAVMRRGKIMEPAVAEAVLVDCGPARGQPPAASLPETRRTAAGSRSSVEPVRPAMDASRWPAAARRRTRSRSGAVAQKIRTAT